MNYLTPRFDWLPCDLHAACGPRATIRGGLGRQNRGAPSLRVNAWGASGFAAAAAAREAVTGFHYLELAAGCLNLSSVIPT